MMKSYFLAPVLAMSLAKAAFAFEENASKADMSNVPSDLGEVVNQGVMNTWVEGTWPRYGSREERYEQAHIGIVFSYRGKPDSEIFDRTPSGEKYDTIAKYAPCGGDKVGVPYSISILVGNGYVMRFINTDREGVPDKVEILEMKDTKITDHYPCKIRKIESGES